MRAGGVAAKEQRDGRDEGLGQGGPDRGEQAAYGGLGDPEPMPGPFDAIGEKLRSGEDYDEAESENGGVK